MWINYKVDVGSGCTESSVFVVDEADEKDIKCAILDDLYDVYWEIDED